MSRLLLSSMPGGGEWLVILLILGLIIFALRFSKVRIIVLLVLGSVLTIASIFFLSFITQQESSLSGAARSTFDRDYQQEMDLARAGCYAGLFAGILFLVLGIIAYMRHRNRITRENTPPPPTTKTSTASEKLERLYELKQKGVLTEEEYQVQKKKILDGDFI